MVTALGLSVEENKAGLLSQKQALSFPEILDTQHRNLPLGEIKLDNEELKSLLAAPGRLFNRTTLLGLLAMKETLGYLPEGTRGGPKIAFINATTVGGISEVENHYMEMISAEKEGAFMSLLDTFDSSDCSREIARFFHLSGFRATVSTACSSAINAIQFGARMIENGLTDIAICGGTDALSRFTLNGFNSLKNVDTELCRPFDQHRNGLNLGEGAGYLMLESESSAEKRNAGPLALLAGYGNTNEAHHPTAPAPDGSGARRTMQAALARAGIGPEKIDFINAHGTATIGNDLAEGKAIAGLFGQQDHPPFSSLKSYLGHTLAASGSIEAILSCLALRDGFIPASLRFETPMEELGIRPQQTLLENACPEYILNNSFGFGGNDAAVVLRKV
jgi:3-oxoacyl-[acyl-carrier-protein] synthase-1